MEATMNFPHAPRVSCARSMRCAVALLAIASSASLAFADVRVVNASSGPYTTIQAAISAAQDGDTLLVKPGSYAQFILDAKSLTIVADAGGSVNIGGACAVRNLNATQRAVLSGLTIAVPDNWNSPAPDHYASGLNVTNNAGEVRVDACTLIGRSTTNLLFSLGTGGDGARVAGNAGSVVLVACVATGGRGQGTHDLFAGSSAPGGSGVFVQDTRVALYNCTLTGGRGGDGFDGCGRGGHGAWLRTSTLSAGLITSGCQLTGGRGGDDWEDTLGDFTAPGSGGDGMELEGGTLAQIVEDVCAGGAAGVGIYCTPTLFPAGRGVGIGGAGSPFTFSTSKVVLGAPVVLREMNVLPITVRGQPGDHAYLFVSRGTAFNAIPSWHGVVLTQNANPPRSVILGTIPASGVLNANLTIPDLGPGVLARDLFLQAYRLDAAGSATLGNLAVVSVLDASF
jgi:hypothetical protein